VLFGAAGYLRMPRFGSLPPLDFAAHGSIRYTTSMPSPANGFLVVPGHRPRPPLLRMAPMHDAILTLYRDDDPICAQQRRGSESEAPPPEPPPWLDNEHENSPNSNASSASEPRDRVADYAVGSCR
jgi:hypothetical protein